MVAAFEFRGHGPPPPLIALVAPTPIRPGSVACNSASGERFSSDGSSRIGDCEAVCRFDLAAIIANEPDAAHLSGWHLPTIRRRQLAEEIAAALRETYALVG
jgi:hypothetical protein